MPLQENGKYIPRPKDPLNILQRARLCYDCGDGMLQQKRFADAAVFFEATAQLANQCFNRLKREINNISTGDTSLYDIVNGDAGHKMLMFKLLPGLKQRAAQCYQQIVSTGNAEQDKYDI